MRRNGLAAVGAVIFFGFLALPSVTVAMEHDVDAINKVRDMEVASIYAADVEYIPPGEPALKGTDAVQGWLAAMLEQFEGNLEYTASDVKVLGDWAIEQVRGIHVYHCGEDGDWKITHDIWNYDAPHAPPD